MNRDMMLSGEHDKQILKDFVKNLPKGSKDALRKALDELDRKYAA